MREWYWHCFLKYSHCYHRPVDQESYWIYRARDFPTNFIAPLCDLTKPEWLHLVRSSTKS